MNFGKQRLSSIEKTLGSRYSQDSYVSEVEAFLVKRYAGKVVLAVAAVTMVFLIKHACLYAYDETFHRKYHLTNLVMCALILLALGIVGGRIRFTD